MWVRVRGGRVGWIRSAPRGRRRRAYSSDDGAAKLVAAVVAFAIGWFLWGFLEYAFHRFAFHRTPRGRLGITAHFIAHGCHHKAPMDRLRLVFPPAASAPVIYAAGLAFDAVAPAQWLALFAFAGCLLGYVAYDCSHYALHHAEFGGLERSPRKIDAHGASLRGLRAILRHHVHVFRSRRRDAPGNEGSRRVERETRASGEGGGEAEGVVEGRRG